MTKLIKKASVKGNRTFTVAGVIAIISMLHQIPEVYDFLSYWIPPKYNSLIGLVGAAAMFYMRTITTTPPGNSGE